MKPIRKITLMLVAPLLLLSANILVLEANTMEASLTPFEPGNACHRLMTEAECSAFLATLADLPAGEGKARFLAAHDDLMRERESACSCNRLNADPTVLYPNVPQVALAS